MSFNYAETSARAFLENLLEVIEDTHSRGFALVTAQNDLQARVQLISDPPLLYEAAKRLFTLRGTSVEGDFGSIQLCRIVLWERVQQLFGSEFARGRLLVWCADTAQLVESSPLAAEQITDLIKAYKFFGIENDLCQDFRRLGTSRFELPDDCNYLSDGPWGKALYREKAIEVGH